MAVDLSTLTKVIGLVGVFSCVGNAAVAQNAEQTLSLGAGQQFTITDEDYFALQQRLQAWRNAWMNQDWQAYADNYTADYAPKGMNHHQWVGWRKLRISKPDWIRVDVKRMKIIPGNSQQVSVRFWQSYQSPGYVDRSLKELSFVQQDGVWLIDYEHSLVTK